MKSMYFLMLALAGCLSSCVKYSPVSSANTSSLASAPTVAAARSLYTLQTAGGEGALNGIEVDYDSAEQRLTIVIDATGAYKISVASFFKGPLYSGSLTDLQTIEIDEVLQQNDVITVTVTNSTDTLTESYIVAGGSGINPTPPPSRFYINVTSNLEYTQLNVTWAYSGSNPAEAGDYYFYLSSYCPDRSVSFSNIGAVSAGASTYTYTWYRPYTTYDSAYITVMVEGVSIPSDNPVGHFSSNGGYVYLANMLIPQTCAVNFQTTTYPYYVYFYDACNGPCVVAPPTP